MRKQEERPSHELWSFARYLNKVFAFRSASDRLTVSRHQPEISAPAVFRAVFYGLVFRLTSFQQLQSDIAQPAFQRWIGVERAFGDDVLRYSLCGFDLSALETMLVQVNRTLKRNKGLDSGRGQGRIVAALDGIEVLSSYSQPLLPSLPGTPHLVCASGWHPVRAYSVLSPRGGMPDRQRSGKTHTRHRMAAARRGRRYCRPALIPAYGRTLWQPLLRHPAAGFALRAGSGASLNPRTGLGCGHCPQARTAGTLSKCHGAVSGPPRR